MSAIVENTHRKCLIATFYNYDAELISVCRSKCLIPIAMFKVNTLSLFLKLESLSSHFGLVGISLLEDFARTCCGGGQNDGTCSLTWKRRVIASRCTYHRLLFLYTKFEHCPAAKNEAVLLGFHARLAFGRTFIESNPVQNFCFFNWNPYFV